MALIWAAAGAPAGPPPAEAGAALPPLPTGWPAVLHLGVADPVDAPTAVRVAPPFGLRYHYLSGGVNTGSGWTSWGADFVRAYVQTSADRGLIPVLSYYMLLQSAPGNDQGEPFGLFTNLANAETMSAYYADVVRVLQQAAAVPGHPVVLHVEPDLWGHVQQRFGDGGAAVRTEVASTGRPELSGLPDTVGGFAGALARLRDLHAPNVRLAYHLSSWGTNRDFRGQNDATVDDMASHAAGFFKSLGEGFDLVVGEFADRDAGFRQVVGGDGGASWWGPADFDRHVRFLATFVTQARRRVVLWQIPLGNTRMRAMNNTWNHYQDNRVEWLLDDPSRTHLTAYREAGVIAFLFGRALPGTTCACDAAGDGVTDPPPIGGNVAPSLSADDDGGFFAKVSQAYYAAGAMPLPDVTAPAPGHLAVSLRARDAVLRAGGVLALDLTMENAGPAAVADVYFGIRLPATVGSALGCADGNAVVWLGDGFGRQEVRCLGAPLAGIPRLARRLAMPAALPLTAVPEFFRARLPAGVPEGEYVAVLGFAVPDAFADGRADPGDVLAAATAGFTITR